LLDVITIDGKTAIKTEFSTNRCDTPQASEADAAYRRPLCVAWVPILKSAKNGARERTLYKGSHGSRDSPQDSRNKARKYLRSEGGKASRVITQQHQHAINAVSPLSLN
jgi:hypothetical protein